MTKNGHLARNAEQARKRHERARARLLAAVAECEVSFAAECAAASTLERVHESAPQFTRDEAIALAKQEHVLRGTKGGGLADERARKIYDAAYTDAIRNLMRALAAAGVFVDSDAFAEKYRTPTMSDLLDAAGIR